jgi:hypothetical protein
MFFFQEEEENIRSRVEALMSDCNDDISDDDNSSSHHSSNYNSFKDNSSKNILSKDNLFTDNSSNDNSSNCQRKEAKQPEQPRLPFAVKSAPPPLRGVVKRTPPTSPTSSPSKRPRRLARPSTSSTTTTTPTKSPVLELLQSKKKGQRSGLYQWVLWREALKGEKDRKNEDPSERTCVIRNLNNSFTKTSTI